MRYWGILLILMVAVGCTDITDQELRHDPEKKIENSSAIDYEVELKNIETAIKNNPENKTLWCMKGQALIALGKYNEAFDIIEECRKASYTELENWYCKNCKSTKIGKRGDSLEGDKKHWYGESEKALEIFDSFLESNPNNDDVWLSKAIVLEDMGRYNESLEAYDAAIEAFPFHARRWFSKASLLIEMGRYDEALETYDGVIYFEPTNEYVWRYKTSLLEQLERYDESIETYDEWTLVNHSNPEPWSHKATFLLNQKRYEEGVEAIEHAIELNQNDWRDWFYKGLLLFSWQKHERAIEAFDKTEKLLPGEWKILDFKITSLKKLNRTEEALKLTDDTLTLYPDAGPIWGYKGELLSKLNDSSGALIAFDTALELGAPGMEKTLLRANYTDYDMGLYFKMGRVYMDMENYSAAVESFNKALEIDPEYEEALKYRETALANLNN